MTSPAPPRSPRPLPARVARAVGPCGAALGAALLGALGACQPAFPVERHLLGPPRLAALGAVDGQARAAVYSGLGLFHTESPVLRWEVDGEALGEGYGITLDPSASRLEVEVELADGSRWSGGVDVGEAPPLAPLRRSEVELGRDLSLQARRSVDGTAVIDGASDDQLALRLDLPDAGGRALRWMLVDAGAAVLELDESRADVIAAEVVRDDGAWTRGGWTGPAAHAGLLLAIDGAGGNRWTWMDLPFGGEGPWLRIGERRLAVDTELPAGWVELRLEEGPAPSGLHVRSARWVGPPDAAVPPGYALDCGDGGDALDLDWLAEGRCTRGELLERAVLVRHDGPAGAP